MMYITVLECLTSALVMAVFTLGWIWTITWKSRELFKTMYEELRDKFENTTEDKRIALYSATYSHISEILVEKVLCYYKDISNGHDVKLSDHDIPRVVAHVLSVAKSTGQDSIPLLERIVSYELSPDLSNLCNDVIGNFCHDKWCDEYIKTSVATYSSYLLNGSSSQSDCAPEACGS